VAPIARMSWFDRIFRRKHSRREALVRQPFPKEWAATVRRSLACYPLLPAEHRRILRAGVRIFVAEKEIVGISPMKITDEIKVAIAAQACLLLVGRPEFDVFPRLGEVIVEPHGFGKVIEAVGPDGRKYRIPEMHAGEAWRQGPVVLAWDSVRHSIAGPGDGHNVVFHEFAHELDMQLGIVQGTPPMETAEQKQVWTRVFKAEFRAFARAAQRGQRTFLDPYGAGAPVEFFAVVTEHFFEQPWELRQKHPKLYAQFKLLYGQDPANWGRQKPPTPEPPTTEGG
jgi:Mlc titration factor MtfA (ptsG expression regulator)